MGRVVAARDPPGRGRRAPGRRRTVRLDELGEALGLVLEHDEVDTVSGLILTRLGRPPAIGDRAEHEHVVLEVSAVRGKGVQQARVVSAPERDRPG